MKKPSLLITVGIGFIMFVVGAFAFLIVAANDEGTWPDGSLAKISACIVTLFKFPLFIWENIFHREIFSGSLFYLAYAIGMVIWTIIILLIIKIIQKLNKTS